MEPDPLFERLRLALLPDYRLEREIGSGGMGRVYLAQDLTLNCPVAVKLLRPELDTVNTAQAFLGEAQLIARVHHPNVVTIHHAYPKAGLHYYIMEFIDGPTLEERLEQGPLNQGDTVRVGRDLLGGLERVHRAGIVHRDIKPGNVFVVGDPPLAKLADFGIARGRSAEGSGGGTPEYMSPEQIKGEPATTRSDLYQVGAVLYEAITGQRFPPFGENASWKRVPWLLARVLRRATPVDPTARWPDAREFRHALRRTRIIPYLVRAAMLAIGGIVVGSGLVLAAAFWQRSQIRPGALSVALPRFDYVGPATQRPVADSLGELLRAELRAHPDFRVTASSGLLSLFRSSPSLVIGGRAAIRNGDVQVQLSDMPQVHAPLGAWATLLDSLTYQVLLAVWDEHSPLAASLPRGALPRSALGLARFLEAEQLVARGAWGNAYAAYMKAEAADSTCWLCAWRLSEVERWLGREHDPVRVHRYLSHVNSFPEWYQSLIRAGQLPLDERLTSLHAVTAHWRDFFLGWFQLGDELFHRGPLVGLRRAEAIDAFERAVRRRPDFAPVWEHLTWVYIAEGDSANAVRTLRALDQRNVTDDRYAMTLRALLGLGFAWRFLPDAHALAQTQSAVADPVAGASPELAAGPRMLGSFDAPRGEIAFGEILAANPARDLQRSGLIAQTFGSLALGRPTRAAALARQLAELSPERELTRFAAQLEATIGLLDPTGVSPSGHGTRDEPFARTVAHMLRAAQAAERGDVDEAHRQLLWHEQNDVVGLPTGLPQAAEVDWAFGTLARWRLATLLAANGDRAGACTAYRAVVRLWSDGEPVYRARADTGRQQLQKLGCQ